MENITFEEAMEKLDAIVKKLENNNSKLDEMIDLYTEGLKLAEFCKNKLDNAEQKIIDIDKYIIKEENDE